MAHESFAKEWQKIPMNLKKTINQNFDIYAGVELKQIQKTVSNAWLNYNYLIDYMFSKYFIKK